MTSNVFCPQFDSENPLSILDSENRVQLLQVFTYFTRVLPLADHRVRLKTVPNTFTGDEAITALQSVTSGLDREDATRVIHRYIQGRLLRALEGDEDSVKPKGVYAIGRKGLQVKSDTKRRADSPIVHLEFRYGVCVTDPTTIFKRFAGSDGPNEWTPEKEKAGEQLSGPLNSSSPGSSESNTPRASVTASTPLPGILVKDRMHMLKTYTDTFTGHEAIVHLLETTTAMTSEECLNIADRFMAAGWIRQIDSSEKVFRDHKGILYQVTGLGASIAGWPEQKVPGVKDFFAGVKDNMSGIGERLKKMSTHGNTGTGHLMDDGKPIISKENLDKFDEFVRKSSEMLATVQPQSSSNAFPFMKNRRQTSFTTQDIPSSSDTRARSISISHPPARRGSISVLPSFPWETQKETHTSRLTTILSLPPVRSLFQSFVTTLFCEENYDFMVDAERFRMCYDRSQSIENLDEESREVVRDIQHKKDKETLVPHAVAIYLKYITPTSSHEINIPSKLIKYLTSVMEPFEPFFAHFPASLLAIRDPINPTSVAFRDVLQALPKAFWQVANEKKVQETFEPWMFSATEAHIFQVVAGDSVPKFIRTEEYRVLMMGLWEQGNLPVQKRRETVLERLSTAERRQSCVKEVAEEGESESRRASAVARVGGKEEKVESEAPRPVGLIPPEFAYGM
ncbi:uncharacterized protein SPPG_05473 [Spizellomyces punctatus DAOM BR117]|uniref:RGS domain-containing protein n=1 Tax=Spizellomyces punctatus (strain DAOM BR117) TaxID=645134 RepID=A0A0L0HDL2_SPIPD|nr:uncharacterized protein SPPG_05473 [Spizellomyces punctatus DAOM BR117]KNC99217.1 hypothetical protein SPPG_05473 [Spizellomyces punctatus DAOM BR117]|eukprot:XP_016607257.1 hypothetical protein SPPG_05473 [Spizellomyces punctatus DAOM BR117]